MGSHQGACFDALNITQMHNFVQAHLSLFLVFTQNDSFAHNEAKRGDMELKIYLVKNRLTIKQFCEIIGYSRNQISGVMNGNLRPSPRLAKVIEEATNGEVTVAELLKDKNERA